MGFYVLVCRTSISQINRRPAPINGFDSIRDPAFFDFCQLVGSSRNSSGNIYVRLVVQLLQRVQASNIPHERE